MTKMKNTKKGMAKKTLSISLAVAMLATSNVPVWAAEFSDGTDAAFTSEVEATPEVVEEAPVVEEVVEDVPEAQAEGDAWNATVKDMPAEVEWGGTDEIKVTVKAVDNNNNTSDLKYVWKNASTGYAVTDPADVSENMTIPMNSINAKDNVGNSYNLFIYDTKGDWTYTSSSVLVGAKDVSATSKMEISGTYEYTGKQLDTETLKNSDDLQITDKNGLTKADFNIDFTGDLVNAGTVKVTATPIDTKYYKGVIETTLTIDKTNKVASLVTASMATKEFAYTGKTIKLDKADVTVADKNTNVNLNNLVKSAETTGVLKAGEEGAATVTLDVPADNQNFAAGTYTINTTDKFKVTTRDLSTVDITVESETKKADGSAYTPSELTIQYKDRVTGQELDLAGDVDVIVPENTKDYGTYTITFKPKKAEKPNVTGEQTATFSIFSQNIKGATFSNTSYAQSSVTYTGSQITKDLSKLGAVKLDGKELDPADYNIEFGTNVNAGKGYIYIVGKRTYEGSRAVVEFNINPVVVNANDITVADYVVYNASAKQASDYAEGIALEVKAKNTEISKEFTLKEGTDFKVEYKYHNSHLSEPNTPDNYVITTVTTKENSNFKIIGDKQIKYTRIANKLIKDSDIQMKKTSYEYTGAIIVPEFDVVVDGKTLDKSEYVIVPITNSANVGTATFGVKGAKKSGYDEQILAKASFEITPVSAEKVEVTFKNKSNYRYMGTAWKPVVDDIEVKLNGNNVTNQFDIASYGENINAGKDAGSIVLTPKKDNKNFTADTAKTATFDIEQAYLQGNIKVYDEKGIELKELPTFEYDGTEKTFADVVFVPTNVDGKKKLTKDDYEIKYVNNVTGGGEYGKASIIVVAKGNYQAAGTIADNTTGTSVQIKNVAAQKDFEIKSKLYFTEKEVVVTDAEYAGPGMLVKPGIVVKDGGKTLVEGVDYSIVLYSKDGVVDGVIADPSSTEYRYEIFGKGVYAYDGKNQNKNYARGTWKVVKKDVKNLEIKVDLDAAGKPVLTVMNGNLKVDNKNFDVKLGEDKKTATVSATVGNKYYIGSVEVTVGGEAAVVETPMIVDVQVTGNNAKVILSGEVDGAVGYDYVISTDRDCITNKDYDKVNKNILTTNTTFTYTQQGVYYAYCHAWRRDANGKKVFSEWSNAYPFSVTAITPAQPVITSVKVSGSTVTVTYTKAANADGYDVVLGSKVATVAGEKRPVNYGTLVKKNVKGNTVTATFKNVPAGTYYAGLHAFNRTSEDGKKVFSPWSNIKTVKVK